MTGSAEIPGQKDNLEAARQRNIAKSTFISTIDSTLRDNHGAREMSWHQSNDPHLGEHVFLFIDWKYNQRSLVWKKVDPITERLSYFELRQRGFEFFTESYDDVDPETGADEDPEYRQHQKSLAVDFLRASRYVKITLTPGVKEIQTAWDKNESVSKQVRDFNKAIAQREKLALGAKRYYLVRLGQILGWRK